MSNNLGAAVTAAISRGIILAVSIPFASQMNQHAMNFKTNYTGVIIYMYRDMYKVAQVPGSSVPYLRLVQSPEKSKLVTNMHSIKVIQSKAL